MINTMEVFATDKVRSAGAVSAAASSGIFAGIMTAFADENEALSSVFEKIKGLVGTIFRWIGYMLLLWGVAQLILAFKNEDADSKSRAMLLIGVGAALTAIEAFLEKIVSP